MLELLQNFLGLEKSFFRKIQCLMVWASFRVLHEVPLCYLSVIVIVIVFRWAFSSAASGSAGLVIVTCEWLVIVSSEWSRFVAWIGACHFKCEDCAADVIYIFWLESNSDRFDMSIMNREFKSSYCQHGSENVYCVCVHNTSTILHQPGLNFSRGSACKKYRKIIHSA